MPYPDDPLFYPPNAPVASPTPSDVSAAAAAQSAIQSESFATAASVSADLSEAARIQADADVVLTHADVQLTHADVVATGTDRTATHSDKLAADADVVLTHADVALTHADVTATGNDKSATHADRLAADADVVLTHADVVLTHADVVTAGTSATNAATSETNAAASAAAADPARVARLEGRTAGLTELDNSPNLFTDFDYANMAAKTNGWQDSGTATYVATPVTLADGRDGVTLTSSSTTLTAQANFTKTLASLGIVPGVDKFSIGLRGVSRTGSGTITLSLFMLNAGATAVNTYNLNLPTSITGETWFPLPANAIDVTSINARVRITINNGNSNSLTFTDLIIARGSVSDYRPFLPTLQPGLVQLYPGATAPTGYVIVNAQNLSRIQYARIFGIVGTTFGVGDGSTTFTMPPALTMPAGYITIMKT